MAETEKITINMGAVDLGKIDLLVEQGHYSNRTDFIRTAIRSQLEKHTIEVQQSVLKHSYVLGASYFDRDDLEKAREKGEKLQIKVVGFLGVGKDVTPALADEVIDSVKVYGITNIRDDVREALTKAGKLS